MCCVYDDPVRVESDYMSKHTVEKQKSVKNGIARLVAVVLAVVGEIGLMFLIFLRFNNYAEWISVITSIVAMILALGIFSSDRTAAIKMPWILLIVTMPFAGVFLYALIGMNPSLHSMRNKYRTYHKGFVEDNLKQDPKILTAIKTKDVYSGNIAAYIQKFSGYPVQAMDDFRYFSEADKALEAMKEDLRRAQHFIFMEYFSIEDAEAWAGVQEILEQKAKEGVEIRVIYDDMGSISFIDTEFSHRMEGLGIQCRVFNAFVPGLNLFLNNRDHRKMTIVDGEVAYTGGFNLANEYFNLTHPYGHWKDTGVRFTGEAVNSQIACFLEMWALMSRKAPRRRKRAERVEDVPLVRDYVDREIARFMDPHPYYSRGRGFIQPYAESPRLL